MNPQEIEKLKTISPTDLAVLGMNQVVYLQRHALNDQVYWSIHAADGTEMARLPDRAAAIAACVQHDLEPASVH